MSSDAISEVLAANSIPMSSLKADQFKKIEFSRKSDQEK
jgi:hypothetical protein